MNVVLIGLAGLLVVALLFVLLGKQKGRGPGAGLPPTPPEPSQQPAAGPASTAGSAAVPPRTPAPPAALQAFAWRRADDLPAPRRQALLAELRQTPPPSRAFHQLVSPQFVARASSAELSELVIGEPQVAAQVLARVNSSLYGLQTPVNSIGQAVTFLGLNSVRSLCLQYLLSASFKADTPAQQQRFDTIWLASAVASELCFKLAQQLRLPDPGGMVTQLVLSFLGHFAAAARMPVEVGAAAQVPSLLARSQAQQDRLGLPAAEIGGLLLHEWALPAVLTADVVDIDRLLVTPPESLAPGRAASLAVCYLSARLGERLARGEAVDLARFDPRADPGPDDVHLAACLDLPQLARLLDVLRGPELVRAMQTLLAGPRVPS